MTASGSYDTQAKSFSANAHGTGIDLSRIHWLSGHNLDAAGKLAISITGSGTLENPNLQANATVNTLDLGGQRLGDFRMSAHTANRTLIYDATTNLAGAELNLHASTALNNEYQTEAQLQFSRFNVGALFQMAHIQAVSGESALAGTISISGPLAHPEQLRGDAQLRQLAMTVAGVHLQSEGVCTPRWPTAASGSILFTSPAKTQTCVFKAALSIQGARHMDLAAVGSINLRLAESLDPDLTAIGSHNLQG